MSLATLKRKTAAKYNNSSVAKPQFSINGTTRSQGWVGQSVISRSLPRTTMRGDVPRGTSACCGIYHISSPVVSGLYDYNDASVVKSSSLSSRGMMQTKYRWARRSAPSSSTAEKLNTYKHLTVKPTNSNNLLSHTDRVEKIKQKTETYINSINSDYIVDGVYVKPQISCTRECNNLAGFAINNYNNHSTKKNKIYVPTIKPIDNVYAKSQSDYMNSLKTKCEENDIVNIPSTIHRTPFV